YWNALKDDKLAFSRKPLTVTVKGKKVVGAAADSNKQGSKIRAENPKPRKKHDLSVGTARAWFSPNTKQPSVPKKNPARPSDLKEVYDRMDAAKKAIMFLVFMPGRSGVNNIIGKAAEIEAGKSDSSAKSIAISDGGNDGESARLATKLTSISEKGRFV